MGELLQSFVPHKSEPGRSGGARDGRLGPRQEMPGGVGAGSLVALQIRRLLGGRERGALTRVEAYGDDLEIRAGLEGQDVERGGERVQHLRAEHRTVVVHERHDHGSPPEVIAKTNRPTAFVDERHIERELPGDVLIKPDLAQRCGQGGSRQTRLALVTGDGCAAHLRMGSGRAHHEERTERENRSPSRRRRPFERITGAHLFVPWRAGSPRFTVSLIASSMGIRTTPADLSTQE